MVDFTIDIWETDLLYDNRGNNPARIADHYITETFDRYISNHNAYTSVQDDQPVMYDDDDDEYRTEQMKGDGQYAHSPCKADEKQYDSIVPFFSDWLDCHNHPQNDVHVLLTESWRRTGITWHYAGFSDEYGSICLVEGSKYFEGLSTSDYNRYQPYSNPGGNDDIAKFEGMAEVGVLHHELGHAFSYDTSCDNEISNDHHRGRVTKTDSVNGDEYYWLSPHGLNSNNDNECSNGPYATPGSRRWDILWSPCMRNVWENSDDNIRSEDC